MASSEISHIVATLIRRIQKSTALGYDAIADRMQPSFQEEDLAMYEEQVKSDRFGRVQQCAFDSLALIRVAVAPMEPTWDEGISETDRQAMMEIYPIIKCSLDCIANQLGDALSNAERHKETTEETSTITFEGLFLIAKTGIEMLNPAIFYVEKSALSTIIEILEKASALRPLLNACTACLTAYLCRLLATDVPSELGEGLTVTLAQLKHVFERTLAMAIADDGDQVNNGTLSVLKITMTTVMRRMKELMKDAANNGSQIAFISKVIDCWYGVLVGQIMQLRVDMVQSSAKPVKLGKLMRIIASFPTLPPAHSLRLVLQIALTLQQDISCAIQTETLTALTTLMDVDVMQAGDVVRNNIKPLSEALVEVLFDRRFCGNSHGATDTTDCERQIQLVYCIAQCIRTARSVSHDKNAKMDEFLQKQVLTLLNTDKPQQADGAARLERMVRETQHLPELQHNFPTIEDFMASRDDCELLTRLTRTFNYLLSYSNQALDEAIALVICWLFNEFEFGICLKLLTPLCFHFLRTKRSKMLDGLHNVNQMPTGIASMVKSATTRWKLGGRIFSVAMETYKEVQEDSSIDVDTSSMKSQAVAIFTALLEATVDIAKETAGNLPKELEDCIGMFARMFGFDDYVRLLPLTPLHSIPITSETFRTESYIYMLPILQRQLKGVPLEVYMKHFMPILTKVETLKAKARDCAAINAANEMAMTYVVRSYDALVGILYNILIGMISSATDCKQTLERNNFELLKHILELLDKSSEGAVVACRLMASAANLEGMAPRLIGIFVKRFVALETTIHTESSDVQANIYAIEDALLGAIANCGKFCESKMLVENLESFEAALRRSNCTFDPLIKISRALLPSVDDQLKLKLHLHWIKLCKTMATKNLYLALKRSCETLATEIKESLPNKQQEPATTTDSPCKEVSVYVKESCSVYGLHALSEALNVKPDAKPNVETEEYSKHRICCIGAFVKLLETMKMHGVYDQATKKFVDTLMRPLILEAMINAIAPNNNTRSSALIIYDGICNLKLEEIGDILKLSISALSCKASKIMQIVLVRCLTRLMARHSQQAVKYNLAQVLQFIFRLLTEDNIKLYVQLLKFARVCVVKLNLDQVQWMAPMLMKMFENQSCCQKAKVYVRRVVQKLMVKLTRDQMLKIFPPTHLPLLRNIMAAQRNKRHSKLRKALRPSDDDDDDDDEQFIDKMFKTDDEGRLVLNFDENDESCRIESDIMEEKGRRRQKKMRQKLRKRGDVQPYTYIKLNKAKTSEKHKRENVKALKSLVKSKVKMRQ
ncbi:hypothetical protein, conserved [Babesia bigemina]|uniref:RRP12 HEAT domain-containing protein n=1 Tax=Babesia bigemina TaxID=5866 RepID=A0A061D627_BABBI|nr:hypothetical protein, conserved [Babesia bigemina]CDR96013.1 hypothetical protein, conserved [Babesia bigemina]|eukprot:XP_012768199.1 hypothetical protein, conserved [Babesia bigemina]